MFLLFIHFIVAMSVLLQQMFLLLIVAMSVLLQQMLQVSCKYIPSTTPEITIKIVNMAMSIIILQGLLVLEEPEVEI